MSDSIRGVISPSAPVRGQLSPNGRSVFDGDEWGWQPLWFSRADVIGLCREHFGIEPTGAALLVEGMINQSWRISVADHDRVLRVGRRERTAEQVLYERVAARAWAAVVPQVVVAEYADVPIVDGHSLTVFPFVDGTSGVAVKGSLRARALAPALAKMHRVSLDLGLAQRPAFHSIDDQPRWFGWAQTRPAILERFGSAAELTAPIGVVDHAIAELDGQLDRWRRDGRLDLRAAVHGDLNPRNQLYRDGRLVAVIDTDDCRVEPLIWDVANLAYSDIDVDPAAVWRDYLAAGGPLDPCDEELLVAFARIGALTELVWLADDDGPTHLAPAHLRALADQLTSGVHRDG